MPRLRSLAHPAALLASLPLLAGCFQAEMGIVVGDDGRAEIEFVTALDVTTPGLTLRPDQATLTGPELFAELGVPDVCASTPGGIASFTTAAFEDGNMRGVRCRASDVDVSDLNASSADGTSITITRTPTADGDRWSFQAVIPDLSLPLPAAPAPTIPQDSSVEIFFTISAPGEPYSHNGTVTPSGAVRFDLSDPGPGTTRLYASWRPPAPPVGSASSPTVSGSSPGSSRALHPAWFALPAAVLGVVLVAVYVLARRRRSRDAGTWGSATDPGSVPAEPDPDAPTLPPPGWYRDPLSPTGRRFWDGSAWTPRI